MVVKKKKNSSSNKKKQGFFSKTYSDCWGFIKDSEKHIFFLVILFSLSLIIGVLYPQLFEDFIIDYLKNLFDKIEGYNFFQMLFFIIKNNVTTSFFGVLLGTFLGVFPVLISIINGYFLGFITRKTVSLAGASILLRLLPHGVFELPAVFIALGIGLRLGLSFFSKDGADVFLLRLKKSIKVFFFVVIPLLIIAGIIETSLIFILD